MSTAHSRQESESQEHSRQQQGRQLMQSSLQWNCPVSSVLQVHHSRQQVFSFFFFLSSFTVMKVLEISVILNFIV